MGITIVACHKCVINSNFETCLRHSIPSSLFYFVLLHYFIQNYTRFIFILKCCALSNSKNFRKRMRTSRETCVNATVLKQYRFEEYYYFQKINGKFFREFGPAITIKTGSKRRVTSVVFQKKKKFISNGAASIYQNRL